MYNMYNKMYCHHYTDIPYKFTIQDVIIIIHQHWFDYVLYLALTERSTGIGKVHDNAVVHDSNVNSNMAGCTMDDYTYYYLLYNKHIEKLSCSQTPGDILCT